MSKIQTSVDIPVASQKVAKDKILASLGKLKAKLDSDSGDLLTLKRGSQAKMRLLGGAFISDTDLPVLARISFDNSKPNQVNVSVLEHLVVGVTLGMANKYQRACTQFAKDLADLIKES